MPRKSEITYEEVKPICQELSMQGRAVNYSTVRPILGRGTYPVVNRYIERWRKEVGVENRYPDLPEDVVESLRGMILRIREEAKKEAAAELEAEYREIEQERLAHAKQLAEAERKVHEADSARNDAQHLISVLNLRVDNMERALDAAGEEKTRLEMVGAAQIAENARLKEELQDLKQQLEKSQAQLDQANKDHEAEQQRAEQRYRGLESALLQRHDLEKQPLRDKIAELTKKLEDSTVLSSTLRQQMNAKNTEVAEANARYEQLQEMAGQLQAMIARFQEQLAAANQRADRAEGMAEALKLQIARLEQH